MLGLPDSLDEEMEAVMTTPEEVEKALLLADAGNPSLYRSGEVDEALKVLAAHPAALLLAKAEAMEEAAKRGYDGFVREKCGSDMDTSWMSGVEWMFKWCQERAAHYRAEAEKGKEKS